MTKLQRNFMLAGGQTTTVVNLRQTELYGELIREEVVKELFPALEKFIETPYIKDNIRDLLDAIGDSLVVVYGMALSLGVDPIRLKELIDISNATKISEGNYIKREDGKILKPDTFQPPELDGLVTQIYNQYIGI